MGAAAGLCLYPYRYSYRYDYRPVPGSSPMVIGCTTTDDVPALAYLAPDERARFAATVRGLDARWLANEGSDDGSFLVTLDGTPVARAAAHGHSLHWIF